MANSIPMHIIVQEAQREMADSINTICQKHGIPSWLGLMILDDIVKENKLMSSVEAIKAARSTDISEEADPDVGEG